MIIKLRPIIDKSIIIQAHRTVSVTLDAQSLPKGCSAVLTGTDLASSNKLLVHTKLIDDANTETIEVFVTNTSDELIVIKSSTHVIDCRSACIMVSADDALAEAMLLPKAV